MTLPQDPNAEPIKRPPLSGRGALPSQPSAGLPNKPQAGQRPPLTGRGLPTNPVQRSLPPSPTTRPELGSEPSHTRPTSTEPLASSTRSHFREEPTLEQAIQEENEVSNDLDAIFDDMYGDFEEKPNTAPSAPSSDRASELAKPRAYSWQDPDDEPAFTPPPSEPATEISISRGTSEFAISDKIEEEVSIDDFLNAMLEQNGSDLHLSAKCHPSIRVHGEMTPLTQFRKLSGDQIERAITSIMTTQQRNTFEDDWELDFAYELSGKSRFRVNVMKQQRSVAVVMRTIPWEIKTVEQLNLPPVIKDWAFLPRGLVLVTGPTGSGKSTTLAAIVDHANRNRAGHIMTIEDPVEFVHNSQKSIVNQREVGIDTKSFAQALKHVLRQDPDIILVGEMRDYETISVALSAAETGHLVFGTLHTQSAQETISRIIDVFPEVAQAQVRTQLASTIKGIACQTLLKTYDQKGRIAAVEVLVGTSAIAANIREGKLEQIPSYLQSGKDLGMTTLDDRLYELVMSGAVRWQDAAEKSTNQDKFIKRLGGEEGAIKLDRRIQGDISINGSRLP